MMPHPTLGVIALLLCVAMGVSADQSVAWTIESGTSASDVANAVAVGPSGVIYVAGVSDSGFNAQASSGSGDLVLVKYTTTAGALQWTQQDGTSGNDEATGVAVDTNGNAYIVGTVAGSVGGKAHAGGLDIVVMQYGPAGTGLWIHQAGTTTTDTGNAIAVANGNVFVVGSSLGALNGQSHFGGADIVILMLDTAGALQWTRQRGTSGNDYAHGVAVDSGGSMYVTGRVGASLDGQTHMGDDDIVLIKYDAYGGHQWTREAGSTGADRGCGVAVQGGAVYVGGYAPESVNGQPHVGGDDIVLLSYDTAGTLLWTRETGTAAADYGLAVTADSFGFAYVAGMTAGSLPGYTNAGGNDMFVVKYSSAGVLMWVRQMGSTGNDEATGIAVDTSGNLFISGSAAGPVGGQSYVASDDMVLVKMCGVYGTGSTCQCMAAYSANGITPCTACLPGEWSSTAGATTCQSCSPGQWSSATAAMGCEDCVAGRWTSAMRSTACTVCNAGTWSVAVAASTVDSCQLCTDSTYQPLPGQQSCTACPEGGACPDGSVVPQALSGWFPNPANTREFLRCSQPELCLGGPPDAYVCITGYTGLMCMSCAKQYYKVKNRCEPCSEGMEMTGPIIVIALLVVALFAASLLRDRFVGTVAIAINYVQVIALLPTFPLKWPPFVWSVLQFISFFLFDIGLMGPECVWDGFTYAYRLGFILLLPLVVVALVAIGVYVHAAVKGGNVHAGHQRMLNIVLRLLPTFYFPLAVASLRPFDCTVQPTGQMTMDAWPEIVCWSTDWTGLGVVGFISVAVYVVGLVAALGAVCFSARLESVRAHLYARKYKDDWMWWEFAVTIRKMIITLAQLFATMYLLGRSISMMVVLAIALAAQLRFRPFTSKWDNWLELIMRSNEILAMLCATIMIAAESVAEAFGWIVFALVIVGVVVLIGAFVFHAVRKEKSADTKDVLLDGID